MRIRLFSALSLFLLACASNAQAASPQDVAEVDHMVNDTTIPGVERSVLRKRQRVTGTIFVFVQEGRRYEFRSSSKRTQRGMTDPHLTVTLTEPEREEFVFITDDKLDGAIDLGVNRGHSRVYVSGRHDKREPTGHEHAVVYQSMFDAAIAAAIAYKRAHEASKR